MTNAIVLLAIILPAIAWLSNVVSFLFVDLDLLSLPRGDGRFTSLSILTASAMAQVRITW